MMPLFDDILAQPAILISIGLAFLFIVAAIVLAILPRIKAARARAMRRKAAAQAAQAAQAEQEAIEQEAQAVAQAARKGGKRRATAQAATIEAEQAAVPVAKAKVPAPVAPAAPPVNPGAAALTASLTGGDAAKTDAKEEVSPEMQDLLSSVFSDEDNSERQAILLKGMEPVAIDELLTLTKAVAAQLRGEQPSNIVRVKENQLS